MNVMELLLRALGQVWTTLLHNWPFLSISIVMAAAMKFYLNRDAISAFLRRYQRGGVVAATAAAVTTPLCSCGTTAIILGMMAGSMPWAPIVAFMVASPLTSPEELVYSAGLFGWPFAGAFFAASIVLGLLGGLVAQIFDARGWLKNQARFAGRDAACGCDGKHDERSLYRPAVQRKTTAVPMMAAYASSPAQMGPAVPVMATPCGCAVPMQFAAAESHGGPQGWVGAIALTPAPGKCGCGPELPIRTTAPEGACSCDGKAPGDSSSVAGRPVFRPAAFLREVYDTGRRLMTLFVAFAFVGYLLNDLIPAAWITALFGSGHAYSVPLAATLGLPFYINTEASLPLVRAMLDAGMSSGAALAFLITGAGTSLGAVAGALTIARWRVVALVIGVLWVGAIGCGLAYDMLMLVHPM